MLRAYRIAAAGTRDDIQRQISRASGSALALFQAVVAQYDGDVDGAIRKLRQELRSAKGLDRAAAADLLAPIFVMRENLQGVSELADVLEDEGWISSAEAFRARIAAARGDRKPAIAHADAARIALGTEADQVIQFRVLQRLALAAFYLQRYGEALELATSSAAMSSRLGAWRAAAAAYSIAYNIHHGVTGDFREADRFAGLWRDAALKSKDQSFLQGALVAEYELAALFADKPRLEALDRELRRRFLPEQYAERFAFTFSTALVRGASDVVVMRTLLQVLQDTPGRSKGERSLCCALIAVACAALLEDDIARRHVREAISHLGRPSKRDRAYERRYRRMARASICAACIMLGDEVHANRILSVHEVQAAEPMGDFPALLRASEWNAFSPAFRGIVRVFALANEMRIARLSPAGLTPAEFEVLQLLSSGLSAGRIAQATDRSVNTVYNHTRAILGKLHVSRASEAVAVARRRGFIA
jgi:DNA-binding CsgD family transcriptional regulator